MNREKINRINELSRKSKTMGLTSEEIAEQKALRREYIDAFKGSMKSTLDSIIIVDENGNKRKPGH